MNAYTNIYDLIQPSLFSAYCVKLGRTEQNFESETDAVKAVFFYQANKMLEDLELYLTRQNIGRKDPKTVFEAFRPFAASLQAFREFMLNKNVTSKQILIRTHEDLLLVLRQLGVARSLNKYQREAWKAALGKATDFEMYWSVFKLRTPQPVHND
jgi:hypothetical protein